MTNYTDQWKNIRVHERTRRLLKAKAGAAGQSMNDFLQNILEETQQLPPHADVATQDDAQPQDEQPQGDAQPPSWQGMIDVWQSEPIAEGSIPELITILEDTYLLTVEASPVRNGQVIVRATDVDDTLYTYTFQVKKS